ncbi:hypothetical protein E4U32_002803 [Claviceps aff. humidiphila group G2b]|nr:hypothetical protein E4U32_002803 [Claviceps aff. humidiphila group G2b]
MPSAIEESVDKLWGWMEKVPSRLDKLVEGEGTPGTRLAPTKSAQNDQTIGCRLDFGVKFEKDRGRTDRQTIQLADQLGSQKPHTESIGKQRQPRPTPHATWSYADIR